MKRLITIALLLAPSAALADGKATFAATCAACHGPAGKGDGPAAAGLPVKPANFADPGFWSTRDDAVVKKAIKEGGAAVGKSPMMAPNPSLTDAQLNELVAYMKTLKGAK
ncbi:MAG: c-type cytochrome [Myxococcota bacterium]